MKFGVIGLGAMGKNHVRVYSELGVLRAISDTNPVVGNELAAHYQVPYFQDATEMLAVGNLDAVSIVVPTPHHFKITKQCLEAGAHVLIEKPICPGVDEAEQLINTAKTCNRILTVGYIENYNPIFRELLQVIRQGVFGEITAISIKRVGGIPRSADNVILDLMSHDFNLLLGIFGRQPNKIHTHKRITELGIIDSAQVLLDFGDASATCESNWLSPIKIREIWITGTKNYAHVDLIRQEITYYDVAANVRRLEIKAIPGEPLKLELNSFIKAVQTNDTNALVSGQDALDTLKLTLLASGA